MSDQWEYQEFVYRFGSNPNWCRLGPSNYSEAGARAEFWNDYQAEILPQLRSWLDNGWEPITEVGPSAIKIRTYRGFGKSAGEAIFDTIATVMSAGTYWLFNHHRFAEPTEVRIQMRRRRQ